MDGRRRGGGDAARPARLVAGVARSTRCSPTLPAGGRRAGRAGDARLGARADEPARTRRSPRRSASSPTCAQGSPAASRRSSCAPPSAARIRSRSGARSRSRPARATARSTTRCASSRGASRRSRCTSTSRCPTRSRRCCALRGLRVHVPLLLALSANSPFWQGRDTGLASARVPVFGTFPRVGIPRRVRRLRRVRRGGRRAAALRRVPGADVPVVGRAAAAEARHDRAADHGRADARRPTTPRSSALVQCAVRLEATEGYVDEAIAARPEVLDENRFLATRDGMRAAFIDPEHDDRRPGARHPRRAARRLRAARRRAGLRGRAGGGAGARRRARRPPPAHARGRSAGRRGRPGRSGCW